MKKLLIPILGLLFLVSCSEECSYQTDHELIKQLTAEIEDLEELRDNAPNQSQADVYQLQIDQKAQEMNNAFGDCE